MNASQPTGDSSFKSLESLPSSPLLKYHSEAPPGFNAKGDSSALNTVTKSFHVKLRLQDNSPRNTNVACREKGDSNVSSSPNVASDPVPNEEAATYVFLDLESTGLARFMGASNVHITEIAMIAIPKLDLINSTEDDLSDVRVINKLCLCVKPRTRIARAAADMTGLNDSNLFRQQIFDPEIGEMINSFLNRLPKPSCLLAHNGNVFDFPLLKAELDRVNVQLSPEVTTADTLLAFRAIGLSENTSDVKTKGSSSKKTPKKFTSFTLANIYKHFFKERPDSSHNAESDCIALSMVCGRAKEKVIPWIESNKMYFSAAKPMW